MQGIISKKIFKVVIIAFFLIGLIITNPSGFFNPARNVFTTMLAPFQKVFYSFAVGIEQTGDFLGSIGQLKHENEELMKNNQQLLTEKALLRDVDNENAILREQLDLLPRGSYELTGAFVVSQDPNGMGNWLEIDKGSSDGIEKGDSVIVSRGILIGRVQEVNVKTSKVVLLTNPASTVNVTSLKNGTKGVVKGEYGLGIIFDMILQTDAINIGDEVITSGIGGGIPRGLYVGTVQEIHPSSDHLFQQAVVISPVQASKLRILFVIKNNK
ncbi:MAG: Cell shape-determining protein MreC [Candidatus Moranbacteria bacterium GW2011_GWC2_37_8]|nr:MAG: Cell shape-determining protein MreC [Candidatus Moranbacteria bacterium GW2011_GWC2_37_8]KKQ81337.1 MAG: Cell shape-determining protein MreC [Candidatus Moranbacteria bacterium GW2011_GWD2_38_7]